ncbi:MAG: hypothetical protein US49_C0001G0267 [candidate division TM6 bacterium GW2011_GWF2_37_49]|nr:MAG: hypothetical protein US49_C0001G0267 [candidate division TM6 bacterium GW2011_GWF2_37_49]
MKVSVYSICLANLFFGACFGMSGEVGPQVINDMRTALKEPCLELLSSSDMIDFYTFEKRVQAVKNAVVDFETKISKLNEPAAPEQFSNSSQAEPAIAAQPVVMPEAPKPAEPQVSQSPVPSTPEISASQPEQVSVQAPTPEPSAVTNAAPAPMPIAAPSPMPAAAPESAVIEPQTAQTDSFNQTTQQVQEVSEAMPVPAAQSVQTSINPPSPAPIIAAPAEQTVTTNQEQQSPAPEMQAEIPAQANEPINTQTQDEVVPQ